MSNEKFKIIVIFFLAFFAVGYVFFQYTNYSSISATDIPSSEEQKILLEKQTKQEEINKELENKISSLEEKITNLETNFDTLKTNFHDYKNISNLSLKEKNLKYFKDNKISFFYPKD